MKRCVGLFVAVVFAISAGMAYGTPSTTTIEIYGKGKVVVENTIIILCAEPVPTVCAVIELCNANSSGGQNAGPAIGDPCRVRMQDGSGEVYEGILLEIGENNQSVKIDLSTQCPEE